MNRVPTVLLTFLAILALGLPKLEAAAVDTSGGGAEGCSASTSHVGFAVREALTEYHPDGHWEVTTCNEVPSDWLFYMPPGTAIPFYFEYVANLIGNTQNRIDISMLNLQDERRAILAQGILTLHERFAGTGLRPLVRIMTGLHSAGAVYDDVTDLLPEDEPWNVQVIAVKIGQPLEENWNHTKMAIQDGCFAVTGSVETDVESEIAMALRGEAAAAALAFHDAVWSTYLDHQPWGGCAASDDLYCEADCILERCWEQTIPPTPECSVWPGNARTVFSLGRGAFQPDFDLSADTAVFTAIDAATDEIVLLQRSLEWRSENPNYVPRLYRELSEAAARGVRIRIMVGDGNVFFGSPEEIAENLGDFMEATFDGMGLSPAERRAAHRNLRLGEVKTHAKVYMVDRQAFYVGSQNLYPSGLEDGEPSYTDLYEQGFLVDDGNLAGELGAQLDALWADAGPHLWSPYAFDGTYDVRFGAQGSGPAGEEGSCTADFTLEIVRGTIQDPSEPACNDAYHFLCTGTYNGDDPIEVCGRITGGIDTLGGGFGLIYGTTPSGSDFADWTGSALGWGDTLVGTFSGLVLGIEYSGSFVGR